MPDVLIEPQIVAVYAVARLAKLGILKDALAAAVASGVCGSFVGLGEVSLLVVVTMRHRL